MLKHLTQINAHLFGIAIATLCVCIYILSDAYKLEEHFGLDTLYRFRGIEKPPEEVTIVALEKSSSDSFGVPNNPVDWPRKLHAQLIDKLNAAGVSSITFDLFFKQPKSTNDDAELSRSIENSKNVVLVSHVQREIRLSNQPSDADPDLDQSGINIEKVIAPLDVLAQKAVAIAPFVLPKYPIKVTKFWTYRVPAGDIPNVPAVTLQLYCPDAYTWLRQQLVQRNNITLPEFQTMLADQTLVSTMIKIRSNFMNNPALADLLADDLQRDNALDQRIRQQIKALIALYSGPHRYYLNFFGPPWTIKTIPYHQALSLPAEQLDLANKSVFVGFSERLQPEQKDNFNTVYSQSSGLDLSGVEIAATAFANLLHQRTLTPLQPMNFLALIFVYCFVIAFIARSFKPAVAVSVSLCIAIAYVSVSRYLFAHQTMWLPWVIPVLLMTPLTLFLALSWHYFDAYQDRKRIRAAFGMYLPQNVISELSRQRDPSAPYKKVMYGIVLATDAAEYTNLAETMSAADLGELMNQYYGLLFQPVKDHGGNVCDVVGDAMMAIWSASESSPALRENACLAAIDIKQNLGLEKNRTFALPTRIGLHAGEIALANVGAIDHYEYRAVGDIVNTASRIESFNKQLGTRCLASSEVIKGTNGLLHRELGTFTLAGKSKPITLFEILKLSKDATDTELQLCGEFARGITAYRNGNIQDANGIFTMLKNTFPKDGPTQFYVELCQRVEKESSTFKWDSVIAINTK